VRIAIIVEGKTELAFKETLRKCLETRLAGMMPKLDFLPYDGRVPKERKLRRLVEGLLDAGNASADHVIALSDVYTGTAEFTDAEDAKKKMATWVGNDPRFVPHVALHDFEAWLLPYWPRVKELAGHNKAAPSGAPESVNHEHPPCHRIQEIFRIGAQGRRYVKARDATRILRGQDLIVSIAACPELRSFVNTILKICGGQPV
jgi:hypothetical protein